MLADNTIVGFVATTDADCARAFYRAGANTLRISSVPALTPAPHTVLGWLVEDIVNTVAVLHQRGVGFATYPGLEQDEAGICRFPGARVAWLRDPDGNILSLTEIDAI